MAVQRYRSGAGIIGIPTALVRVVADLPNRAWLSGKPIRGLRIIIELAVLSFELKHLGVLIRYVFQRGGDDEGYLSDEDKQVLEVCLPTRRSIA
jgi:hypothetical protein